MYSGEEAYKWELDEYKWIIRRNNNDYFRYLANDTNKYFTTFSKCTRFKFKEDAEEVLKTLVHMEELEIVQITDVLVIMES